MLRTAAHFDNTTNFPLTPTLSPSAREREILSLRLPGDDSSFPPPRGRGPREGAAVVLRRCARSSKEQHPAARQADAAAAEGGAAECSE